MALPIVHTFLGSYDGKLISYNGSYLKFPVNEPELSSSLKMTVNLGVETRALGFSAVVRLPLPFDNQYSSSSTTTYFGNPTTYSYNFVIDWGDGSPVSDPIISADDSLTTHEYTAAGEYQITITGLCEAIFTITQFLDPLDENNYNNFIQVLKSIDSWGDTGLKTIVFNSCESLETLPTDGTSLFGITNFNAAFSNCLALTSIPADLFDNCPNVDNFAGTFAGCNNITSAVPELWVDYPLTNGDSCFAGCTSAINYADIPEAWGGGIPYNKE